MTRYRRPDPKLPQLSASDPARATDGPAPEEGHGPMPEMACSACHEHDDPSSLRVIGGRFLHPSCAPVEAGSDLVNRTPAERRGSTNGEPVTSPGTADTLHLHASMIYGANTIEHASPHLADWPATAQREYRDALHAALRGEHSPAELAAIRSGFEAAGVELPEWLRG